MMYLVVEWAEAAAILMKLHRMMLEQVGRKEVQLPCHPQEVEPHLVQVQLECSLDILHTHRHRRYNFRTLKQKLSHFKTPVRTATHQTGPIL